MNAEQRRRPHCADSLALPHVTRGLSRIEEGFAAFVSGVKVRR
jgi:hypothetical protein